MLNKMINTYLELTALMNQSSRDGHYKDSLASLSDAKIAVRDSFMKYDTYVCVCDHVTNDNPYVVRAVTFVSDNFYLLYKYNHEKGCFKLEFEEVND